MKVEMQMGLQCEHCGSTIHIKNLGHKLDGALIDPPLNSIYTVKLARVCAPCRSCDYMTHITILLIRGYGETPYKGYQIHSDDDPQAAMKKVCDAMYTKTPLPPICPGTYWGRSESGDGGRWQ